MAPRPRSPRARGSRGFTLLEAVLAVAILAGVAMVCVTIRTQMLASARRMEARHERQRDTQAIFDMLTSGMLPPIEGDADAGVRHWKGEYLGQVYSIEGVRTTVPNPVARVAAAQPKVEDRSQALSDQIVMWRYTLEFRGVKTEFWWHR